MALHKVVMTATVIMDEMDGSVEESALIALEMADKALRDSFPSGEAEARFGRDDVAVEVEAYYELEA